jgi:hypothetical protein
MSHQDELYLANRFSADVDRLLEQQDRIEETPVSAEYEELLGIAERLASLDFSAGHPLHERLRRELMARYRERYVRRRLRVGSWPRPRWRAALAGLAVVLLCVGLLAVYPPARVLAQETWQTVLRTVQLVRALPRLSGGVLAAGLTTSIESPTEAVPLVDFPVRVPSYLPQDYEFKYGLVSHLPVQSVSFDYGIPYGRIVTLPSGRAISGETYRGLRISQMKGNFPGPWPIGGATVEEVNVGGQPGLWLTGLPMVQAEISVIAQKRVTVKTTMKDNKVVEQEILSEEETPLEVLEETPPEVLDRTPATALMWEEDDLLLSVLDLDGRFPLEEMIRVAEGLVLISTVPPEKLPIPTPRPETTWQELTSVEEMVAGASFSPYVFDPLPQGWQLESIASLGPSDRPLERRYLLCYRHSRDAYIRLIEGLSVPLLTWPNDIERGDGALRHVADNGLEVWTSDMHQWSRESSIKETARSNERPIPDEVHAMFLRTPNGFSLELIAVDVSWTETLALIEHLTLAPGADPALNSRLMKGCYPCP